MFPDSSIAKSFKYGATKCSYLSCFGLFPYFHEQLVDRIRELVDRIRDAPFYSFSFDECMNKNSQNEQMDFIVRYWDSHTGQVSVRYLGSEFLGHPTVADLLTHSKYCIRQLDPKRLLHGWTQCELEVLHWSGTRTQNTGTPRTSEHRQLKSHGNSLNCRGIVLSDFCGNPVTGKLGTVTFVNEW